MKCGKKRIGKNILKISQMKVFDYNITEQAVKIKTLTPVVAKQNTSDGKTVYYAPDDVMFLKRIREDFENKFLEIFGEAPDSSVDILPSGKSKKFVTCYKGLWITAYHGTFQLCGKPEYLNFLYNTGIGAKNSQGFGMFEVV